MSSENSSTTNQRLRHFGFYRSIDARTEEFLKLSKKRQLKQGCACAAVSTAITVTIVVSVILIHEYRFGLSANNKTTWFGPMNESNAIFPEKQDNSKAQFDKATVKLLPLLLKALNNNIQLQNIIEDYSVPNVSAEIKNSRSYHFKNSNYNTVTKMPKIKLNKLEYKPFPRQILRKTTTESIYSRIKKADNYESFSKYLDKILSEKLHDNITSSSIIPKFIAKNISPNRKNTFSVRIENDNTHKASKPILKNKKYPNCKCNKELVSLLKSFVFTIQNLIPDIKNILMACNYEAKIIDENNKKIIKIPYVIETSTNIKSTINPSITKVKLEKKNKKMIKQQDQQKLTTSNIFSSVFDHNYQQLNASIDNPRSSTPSNEIVTEIISDPNVKYLKKNLARTYLIHGNNLSEYSPSAKPVIKSIENATKSKAQSIMTVFKNINEIFGNSTPTNNTTIESESEENHYIKKSIKNSDRGINNRSKVYLQSQKEYYIPVLKIVHNREGVSRNAEVTTRRIRTTTINKINNYFRKLIHKQMYNEKIKNHQVNFDRLTYDTADDNDDDYIHANNFNYPMRKIHKIISTTAQPSTITTKPSTRKVKKKYLTTDQLSKIMKSTILDNKPSYLDDEYDANIMSNINIFD